MPSVTWGVVQGRREKLVSRVIVRLLEGDRDNPRRIGESRAALDRRGHEGARRVLAEVGLDG